MLKLVELLKIDKSDYSKYKVHFATGTSNKREAYERFLTNGFDSWQSYQTKKNFTREYVISLIYYEKDIYFFGGVYKVNNQNPKQMKFSDGRIGWRYDLSLTDIQKDMIGKVFLHSKRGFRMSYTYLETTSDLCVSYILDKRISINDFNGFDNVNISYSSLKYIVENNIVTWKTALSNVKGVYLITDKTTGKHYVGSAYGENCIWHRWAEYSRNGHGGNIELKNLLDEMGENHKENFTYSILEVCNMNLGNEYIIERENHWKEVLMTRTFGLNNN